MISSLIWDVDGTMAETERDGHRVAFNRAFEALGLAWRWENVHYGELLRITGGRERLLHDMTSRGDAPAQAKERALLAGELHRLKNSFYAEIVSEGAVPLREGVPELIEEAAVAGLRQGIATTTSRSNVEALLNRQLGASWTALFGAVVCGEDVSAKKPDPQVYHLTLHALGVPSLQTVALEDSPQGVKAAQLAEVPVVVTRSFYFSSDTVESVLAVGPGLQSRKGWRPGLRDDSLDGRVTLDHLRAWHDRMELVSHQR